MNLNDIDASQKLVRTYIVILQDDESLETASRRLRAEFTASELNQWLGGREGASTAKPEALRRVLRMSAVEDTEVLRIEARTGSPLLSARICSVMAEIAPEMLLRVVKAGSVEMIGEAKPDYKPSAPDILLNSIIGTLLGAALSCAGVLLHSVLDRSVKGADELKRLYNIPVLGEIPDFDANPANKRKGRKNKPGYEHGLFQGRVCVLDEDTPFAIAEAYRTARTNLLFSIAAKKARVIVFSSALASEGKSTVCSNIAVSMAQTGAFVLLIDADLRKPAQHRIFGRENKKGLSGLLAGFDSADEALQSEIAPNLSLITAGMIPPNPSELLSSAKMSALISEMSGRYDYIFIDSSPVNIVADPVILTGKADGIILTTRQGQSRYDDLSRAVSALELTGANILGLIVTGVKGIPFYGSYVNRYGK